jgi:hypothetical protein
MLGIGPNGKITGTKKETRGGGRIGTKRSTTTATLSHFGIAPQYPRRSRNACRQWRRFCFHCHAIHLSTRHWRSTLQQRFSLACAAVKPFAKRLIMPGKRRSRILMACLTSPIPAAYHFAHSSENLVRVVNAVGKNVRFGNDAAPRRLQEWQPSQTAHCLRSLGPLSPAARA